MSHLKSSEATADAGFVSFVPTGLEILARHYHSPRAEKCSMDKGQQNEGHSRKGSVRFPFSPFFSISLSAAGQIPQFLLAPPSRCLWPPNQMNENPNLSKALCFSFCFCMTQLRKCKLLQENWPKNALTGSFSIRALLIILKLTMKNYISFQRGAGQITLYNPFPRTEFFEDLHFKIFSLFTVLEHLWYTLFSVPHALYQHKHIFLIC